MNPHFFLRERCPVCGSGETAELFRSPYLEEPIRGFLERLYASQGIIDFALLEDAEYALRECPSCSLIFQEQLPDDWLSEIVYEQWNNPDGSLHRKEQNSTRSRGRTALELMAIVDFLGRDPRDMRFLDFGMGWGFWVQLAEAFGLETHGAEVSPSRVEFVRSKGLKVGTLAEFEPESFDFINTQMVFEHLFDPRETAERLVKLLKPDGILKIAVPNGMRLKRRLTHPDWTASKGSRRSLFDVSPLNHVNCFVHVSLVALGERTGLRPAHFPAKLRYRYAPTWERPRNFLKRTVGQQYRDLRRQSTSVWFRRADAGERAPV